MAVFAAAVVIAVGAWLHLRFAPKRLEDMTLIEERTEIAFPESARLISGGQDNLGMDFAIWAVIDMPRTDAVKLLDAPGVESVEGEGELAEPLPWLTGYWQFAPAWLPPLPGRFGRYLGAHAFVAGGPPHVMEFVIDLSDPKAERATVYVFYTTI